MSKLVWDADGSRYFELGVSKGVLFVKDSDGTYGTGVAWSGLTAVNDSPDGAEANDMYADDIKYGTLRSVENQKGSIEAYTYPDEFNACNGFSEPVTGLYIGQQSRSAFGFSYCTTIGNDTSSELGYKIHIVYGATVSPSERAYETVNDSPEAITFSWDYETVPVSVTGHKATAKIEIDSTKADATALATLEDMLYGTSDTESTLPMPDEIIEMFEA